MISLAPKLTFLALATLFAMPAQQQPLYENPSAPLDKRVDDLMARMTLPEKVSQLMNDSQGEPLFPFGFGLSYTTFAYHNLRLPPAPTQATM